VNFDLTDLALFEKGFPQHVFTWLRREAPVYWHEPTSHTPDGEGFWVVSRHADALRVLLDPVAFSSVTGGSRRHGGSFLQDTPFAGVMLNMMDPARPTQRERDSRRGGRQSEAELRRGDSTLRSAPLHFGRRGVIPSQCMLSRLRRRPSLRLDDTPSTRPQLGETDAVRAPTRHPALRMS
jgi:hypothetical protein